MFLLKSVYFIKSNIRRLNRLKEHKKFVSYILKNSN